MNLVVDNQLPAALCRHLLTKGVRCEHVADWGLDEASDLEIWREAGRRHFGIISKDEDFLHLAEQDPEGPAIVWLRLGNCRKTSLLAAFDSVLPRLLEALREGHKVVEIR